VSYAELNRAAALRFLQTAVVVDDAASVSSPDRQGRLLTTPGVRSATRLAAERARPAENAERQPTAAPRAPLDVKALSDALADRGITCGVLKPSPEEKEQLVIDRVVSVSARVDLVVLDWVLDPVAGVTSLEAVKRIVHTDRRGCRVIAIYTSEPLAEIAAELEQELEDAQRAADDEMMLRVGGTRIALFRKATADDVERDDENRGYSELQLADKLIEVFLDLAQGWVRGIALNTLAAIRENLHAVLTRLDPSLDLGYAGHLLRLEHVEEGALQLIDAIGGELRGVIEDDRRSHETAGPSGLKAWLDYRDGLGELAISRDLLSTYLSHPPAKRGETLTDVMNALNSGRPQDQRVKKPEFTRSATALFTAGFAVDSAREADGDFAILLAIRHAYSGALPHLRLGTILSDRQRRKYWICLQPDCDSVRLKSKTAAFPLMPLRVVNDADKRFHFVVPRSRLNAHLFNPATPAAVTTYTFRPNAATKQVAFKHSRADASVLEVHTTSRKAFVLAGQLKPAHAARVAHGLGQALTRIGLDESEWLHAQSRLPE
jgi:hypothetical protein